MIELLPMYEAQAFSPATYLSKALTLTDTDILVSDGTPFPQGPSYATIGTPQNAETILYQTREGNVLKNVTHGMEGTPQNWSAGEPIGRYFTAADHNTFIKNISILSENSGSDSGSGEQGPPGKSAYESAQEGGFIGTEAEFYTLLADVGQGGGSVDMSVIGDVNTVLEHINGIVSTEIIALESQKQAIDDSLTDILGGELF